MKVMTKFKFKRGGGTRKGKVDHIRVLTPDHVMYRFYFTKTGAKRSADETKRLLAVARKQTKDLTLKK